MTKTRMPMPPSQWAKERQKRIDFGRDSISDRIDAPVVVKPEQDSKKASTGDGMAPEITNGIAPTTEATSQLVETTRNPSLALILAGEGLTNFTMMAPAAMQNRSVRLKPDAASCSPV